MTVTDRPVPSRGGPAGPAGSAAAASALAALPALTWIPIGSMLALAVWAWVAPETVAPVSWPIAVVGALLGVPHGAVDHLVPWWWSAQDAPRARRVAGFALAYAAVAAVALLALLRLPGLTIGVFLVLSAVHFGRGEVAAWAERRGEPVPRPLADLLPGAASGVAVVGLLLWADPATTDAPLRRLSAPLADQVLAVRGAGLVLVAALVAAAVARLVSEGRRLDAAEVLLLAVTFAVAPPLAAFGVYFGLWHALRHTGRLLDLARDAQRAAGRPDSWTASTGRLARDGWLPTAVALAAVAVLWAMRDGTSLEAQVSILLALTFPHAAVVMAWDRRRSEAAVPSLRPTS